MNKGGGIVLSNDLKRVALVVRNNNEYSFPKGHLNDGETVFDCAIREVIEETGCDVVLLKNDCIGVIEYDNFEGHIKCYMYLFKENGNTSKYIDEIDKEKIVWVKFKEVSKLLSYKNLIDFWNNIEDKLSKI